MIDVDIMCSCIHFVGAYVFHAGRCRCMFSMVMCMSVLGGILIKYPANIRHYIKCVFIVTVSVCLCKDVVFSVFSFSVLCDIKPQELRFSICRILLLIQITPDNKMDIMEAWDRVVHIYICLSHYTPHYVAARHSPLKWKLAMMCIERS